MVLPIVQTPVGPYPYGPVHSPYARPPVGAPYPPAGVAQNKGGIIQNLLNGVLPGINNGSGMSADSIMGKLDQVQRVLGIVQKSAPIIQQYGPMVKQMPAMLQMIKALNESDSEDETGGENEEIAAENPLNEDTQSNVETDLSNTSNEEPIPSRQRPYQGQSIPKLFI